MLFFALRSDISFKVIFYLLSFPMQSEQWNRKIRLSGFDWHSVVFMKWTHGKLFHLHKRARKSMDNQVQNNLHLHRHVIFSSAQKSFITFVSYQTFESHWFYNLSSSLALIHIELIILHAHDNMKWSIKYVAPYLWSLVKVTRVNWNEIQIEMTSAVPCAKCFTEWCEI
jgi:hypothetical protein